MSVFGRLYLLLLFSSVFYLALCDTELKECTDIVLGKCFDNDNCNKTIGGDIPYVTFNVSDRSMTVRFPLKYDAQQYTVELFYDEDLTMHTVYKYNVTNTSCPCKEGEVTFYHIFKSTYSIQITGMKCKECAIISLDNMDVNDERFGPRDQVKLLDFNVDTVYESPNTTIIMRTKDSEVRKACGDYLVAVYETYDCNHVLHNKKVFEDRVAITGESKILVRPNLKEGSYCVIVDVAEDRRSAFISQNVLVFRDGTKKHFTVRNNTAPVVNRHVDNNLRYYYAAGGAVVLLCAAVSIWFLTKSCRPPASPSVSPVNPPEKIPVAPGKILLLYGHDPNPRFNSAMRLLRMWLSEHCRCPVADVNDPEIIHDISNNWRQWLLDYLDDKTKSTRVVIVCCREVNHSDFRDGVYKWAVEMLQNKNDDSNKYKWLFVAKIEGYDDAVDSNTSNIRLITPFHSFTLPGHLPNLVARLHGVDYNVEKYSDGKLFNAVSTELSLLSTLKCGNKV